MSTLALTKFFLSRYRKETAGIFLGMMFASMSEGLGIMSLVLVVQIMLESDISEAPPAVAVIFDSFKYAGLDPNLVNLIAAVGVLILVKAIFLIWAETYAVRVNTRIAADFRIELIETVVQSNWQFFTRHRLGRLSNSLHEEATKAAGVYLILCRMASHLCNLAIYVFAAALLSWVLSLTAAIASLFLLRLMKRFVAMSAHSGARQMVANKEMMSVFSEGLIGMKVLKVMGIEDHLITSLRGEVARLMSANFRFGFAKVMTKHIREPFMLMLVTGAAIGYIVFYGSIDGVELGVFVGMLILFQRAINGAGLLQQQYQNLVNTKPFFVSLREAVQAASLSRERLDDITIPSFQGSIKAKDLSVSHLGTEPVLKSVSINLAEGTLTVLVGESGSGKTTLADTLCGLYLPNKGEIMIGQKVLDKNNIKAWRKQIGYVEQEPFLFHDSVRNNITAGSDRLEDDWLFEVLRQSECDRFVSSLPAGVETVVGERGSRLSGGQRQRIAIARAMYRAPRFLVLDEATNGLDEHTEKEILETLSALKGKTTMLFLTHRSQVLPFADQVVRLENGTINSV